MWQLWIQNDNLQPFDKAQDRFEKIGPPQSAVDANLWLQVLGRHFGCEVRLRLAQPERAALVSARSLWPGEW